ncbi:MAG TPA: PQQ-binding-like beta-propeller repeat protein [Ignavibacteriaceae bacterium]|nr:PQQ-binding-like beta-propeller repeat protein [Ignavibacteriaceae bacterium]
MSKINLMAVIAFILSGCSSSIIIVNVSRDSDPYEMYGRIPQRSFSVNDAVSDSISERWEAEINGGFPPSSVTIYDNFVFANDLSGRVFCFDINTGKTLGQLKLKGSVYTAPIAEQFRLIFALAQRETNKSILNYYNYTAGRIIREITIDGLIMTELIKLEDGIVFNAENGLAARYDFSGNLVWETKTKSFTHSSPAFENGFIFFGNDDGEIIALDGTNGSVKYRKKIAGPFFCGASVSDGTAYIGNDDGNLYALDLYTGNVIWKQQTGGRIEMVPAVDDHDVIIGNLKGDIFSLNKNKGSINWVKNLGGVFNTSPLVTKNKLIIPDLNEKIFIAEKKTGEVTNVYNFDGRVKLTPVFHKNFLFIGYDNGVLKAYEFH